MLRRVLSRYRAGCAPVCLVLLVVATTVAAADGEAPPPQMVDLPETLFAAPAEEQRAKSTDVYTPGGALALPEDKGGSSPVPLDDASSAWASSTASAAEGTTTSPEGSILPAQTILPVQYVERSALAPADRGPFYLAREARQEELPPPMEAGEEIVLIEQPGALSSVCFDCPSCGGPACVPGRTRCCSVCTAKTQWGRFWCAMYETICCPDPCWDPTYLPIADSAFYVPTARPTTHTRYRWDAGFNLMYPDRAEWFWARDDGQGLGPQPIAPYLGEPAVDYNELSMYVETAIKGFALTFETPYRSVDPEVGSINAGFGDLIIGTKSLVFDRELFQIAFQFRTFVPAGNPLRGLGVGHVSLEPSLILGFNLSPVSYLQGQIAQWIPIAADSYAGSILHYHLSYNRTLYHILPDVPLIGTLEANGWSFQDGSYTNPTLGTLPANDYTYLNCAVGLRMFVCEWLDAGASAAFALGTPNWAEHLYRLECRVRF